MRTEHGLVFDTSKRDGCDLFYLEKAPGAKIITARVNDALEKAGITNCRPLPLDNFLKLPPKKY